ncbi:Retrotrans gag domain-containing protein [Abeliophyllum distichum]|uniref:Retrotrans gag domain-containing protein n=1 Tax=Abeliophyllum distichum TaxID=126358 RepID=A0ABD1RDK7_9LAMI
MQKLSYYPVSDTKRWYNMLKPRNIRSWLQLKQKFINNFINNRTTIADEAQLYNIQQKKGELVNNHFKRFNKVINKIKNVTDDKALDVLTTELLIQTPFWRDVQKREPKTHTQLVDLS